MLVDAQGLEVSSASTEAIAAVNHFADQALCYGKHAEAAILQAIAADPTWAIAHAYAAAFYLSGESAQTRQQAMPHLNAAKRYLALANPREALYIKAVLAWAARDIELAIAYHEAIADQFPHDLVSVQQGQYHYFYQGDKQSLLHIAERVLPANPDNHYLYGMVAFGLEQCHRLDEAEAMGRRATEMNRHDPWAHHAVAHVMETQGRVDDGIAWMESLSDVWEGCNSMLYTHNWWHVALYYLAKGETQSVLNLYDRHVWGQAHQESPKDQVGAIALLLRLELRRTDINNSLLQGLQQRWQALAPYLRLRIHEHALPFQDLHYVYALARAGQGDLCQEMLKSIQSYAQTTTPTMHRAWADIALPAAKGLVAHANNDWIGAIAHLKPVLPNLWSLGGSHAQRKLFQQVYLDAVQQAERTPDIIQCSDKPAIVHHRNSVVSTKLTLISAKPTLTATYR